MDDEAIKSGKSTVETPGARPHRSDDRTMASPPIALIAVTTC
jgi:hypothetical protein